MVFDQDAVDAVEVLAKVIIGDLEELAFRVVEQVKYVCAVLISIPDDLSADADQFTLNEFLQDDTGMGFDVGGRDNGIRQLGHRIGTADHFKFLSCLQLFDDGQDINGLAFLRQALHGAVYPLVSLQVKTFRFQDLYYCVECALFQA